jgi:hypothetical protein
MPLWPIEDRLRKESSFERKMTIMQNQPGCGVMTAADLSSLGSKGSTPAAFLD